MVQIQQEYKSEYNALNDEDREKLVNEHKENIDHSKKIRRTAPQGCVQDFANICRNIILLVWITGIFLMPYTYYDNHQMTGLKARIGVEGFFCVVRSNTWYKVKPMWHFTSPVLRDYMQIAVGNSWSSHKVGLKLEAFAVAGCDPLGEYQSGISFGGVTNICTVALLNTSKKKADHLKWEIRNLISANLGNLFRLALGFISTYR